VQRAFDRLSANPHIHQIVFADVRKAVVRRFPYCVYYRPHADRVEVIAVFHTSRDPSIWQGRV
jgi:plasmid stabilization system protein ParE